MKRLALSRVEGLIVPGIPFVVSFALSLSTAGAHLYWQDSGLFLVAIKELGVLYPPGFVLYVLLCKAWTLALWFVDFTYAVHLFSATCAALAAGTLAVAARDLLRTKGPLFHTAQEEGPTADWAGIGAGCLAASGYTFWAAGILAKVYAFYFLILSLLLWRMIRADGSGKPRDFTIVAVLIGLAWQAHPSATSAGLALTLFVAFHRAAVGWKGLLWRIGLAAVCAMGPVHLIPLLARCGSSLQFQKGEGFFTYVLGSRFTDRNESFGLEASRVWSFLRYGWEEFLGIGLLLVAGGFWRLWIENRRLLFGVLAWVVPVLTVTISFKLEGQHDFWMVAAWLPLWLVAAVGLSWAGKVRKIASVLALAGTVWAVAANWKDLDQRTYTMTETFGRYFLERAEPGSGLLLESDDAQASTLYLQRIRGVRPDLTLRSGILSSQPSGLEPTLWYYERPFHDIIRHELEGGSTIVAAGAMTREAPKPGETIDPSVWNEPIAAEDLSRTFRRPRGQQVTWDGFRRMSVSPEPYEMRLLRTLLLARIYHAMTLSRQGRLAEAARLYESVLALDPPSQEEPELLNSLAVVYVGLARYPDAEAQFKKILALPGGARLRPVIYYFLAGLCGDRPEAAEWKAKALKHPDLPMELRLKLTGH